MKFLYVDTLKTYLQREAWYLCFSLVVSTDIPLFHSTVSLLLLKMRREYVGTLVKISQSSKFAFQIIPLEKVDGNSKQNNPPYRNTFLKTSLNFYEKCGACYFFAWPGWLKPVDGNMPISPFLYFFLKFLRHFKNSSKTCTIVEWKLAW